jgi:prepilin-type N-terminal cleavage/methylation domain-containing protein
VSHRPTTRPAGAGRRGFTIVELLATLALVGIVLPVVVHGVLLCLETAAFATQQAEAAALARSKLEELVATGQWYESEMEGDFGEDRPEYRWASLTGEWEDSRLSELIVFVSWTRRGQEHVVVLGTLIYTGMTNE